jgi:hypothetical protein
VEGQEGRQVGSKPSQGSSGYEGCWDHRGHPKCAEGGVAGGLGGRCPVRSLHELFHDHGRVVDGEGELRVVGRQAVKALAGVAGGEAVAVNAAHLHGVTLRAPHAPAQHLRMPGIAPLSVPPRDRPHFLLQGFIGPTPMLTAECHTAGPNAYC